jgi:hypothetical protein
VRYVEELRAILDSSRQQQRQAALKWGGNVDLRTAHKTIAEQYINADTHIASASQRHIARACCCGGGGDHCHSSVISSHVLCKTKTENGSNV